MLGVGPNIEFSYLEVVQDRIPMLGGGPNIEFSCLFVCYCCGSSFFVLSCFVYCCMRCSFIIFDCPICLYLLFLCVLSSILCLFMCCFVFGLFVGVLCL